MKLIPKPGSPPERILGYGSHGTGKTSAYLSIAEKCPDVTFHVIDSDVAIERMVVDRDLPNVKPTSVESWRDYVEATRAVADTADRHDWLCIDLLGSAWQAAHDFYVESKTGKEVEDFYFEFTKSGKRGSALQGDTDWAQINRIWKAYAALLRRVPCNLFATAAAQATGERDSKDMMADYGHLGVRPVGQKQLGHLFHTVLLFERKPRTGERLLTTAKDRGRRELDKVEFTDFGVTYMLKVAGWRPGQ